MTRELFDIASNHADGEEAVTTLLNTPQGKGKQVVEHGEGTSSRFKRKKKNDKRHHDDNLVAGSRWWSARHRAPRATRPRPHHLRTTLRGS
jgi:hypothetical protein